MQSSCFCELNFQVRSAIPMVQKYHEKQRGDAHMAGTRNAKERQSAIQKEEALQSSSDKFIVYCNMFNQLST